METYFIKTYGCQMNEADSERLAALMEEQGYRLPKRINDANTVIINTCSVRESAENRVFGLVDNLLKGFNGKKKPKIILTGCMVGSAKGEKRRYNLSQLKSRLPGVDEFKTIEELLGDTQISPKRRDKLNALIRIMEGCDHFCSYCVVPYARGKEVSRPLEEIVCEVKELTKRGYREITLLGQNVNSFGKDFSFAYIQRLSTLYHISIYNIKHPFALLLEIICRIKGLKKITFLTSNPWDFDGGIIEAMTHPKIDRYLHLPAQSGDDLILKKMNRPYTIRDYLNLVKTIRRKIPDIKIGTDIIVGFPGETKKDFEKTVSLCEEVGFEKAYIARYSARPGTAAFKFKDSVSPAEKKRRWRILEELINKN